MLEGEREGRRVSTDNSLVWARDVEDRVCATLGADAYDRLFSLVVSSVTASP